MGAGLLSRASTVGIAAPGTPASQSNQPGPVFNEPLATAVQGPHDHLAPMFIGHHQLATLGVLDQVADLRSIGIPHGGLSDAGSSS